MIKKILLTLIAVIVLFTTAAFIQNTEPDPGFLDDQLKEIEQYIVLRDSLDPGVSKVPVAWHLAHSLITINRIYETLEASDPESFKSSFSIPRTISLTFGFIPRGRAQSPQSVRPPEIIKTEDIYAHLQEARLNLEKFSSLNKKAHFEHPVFKKTNKRQAMRFLKVHTVHHLKIVQDILKK